jgi:4-diphosphocytidyl-2-C-methyl-D-erythritol kinase
MDPSRPLERLARPKVNLTLELLGRRGDGYHLLDSLVVFADTGDRLRLESAPELALRTSGPFSEGLPPAEQNLVMRAARALADLAGPPPRGALLTLDKRLPPAGGIGGGSADAAAALLGLVELWGMRPDPKALYDLALSLGADLPVCLNGKACLMRGIGEELEAAPELPRFSLLLVNPGVALETAAVFRQRSGPFTPSRPWPEGFASLGLLIEALRGRTNDLQATALELQPVIGDCLGSLERLAGCLLARMSGSGATCFGLFATLEEAKQAAGLLARERPDWWIEAADVDP